MRGSLFLTRPTLAHYVATREELLARSSDVFAQVRGGTLEVHIGARHSLEQAAEAHEALAARRTAGKSLLVPAGT
jgi:NADPH2:quinone reductase